MRLPWDISRADSAKGDIMHGFEIQTAIMEAEYLNRIENSLSDLAARAAQLRRYL